jgi:hypothetical protein
MNDNNSGNDASIMFIGGAIAVCALGMALVKAIGRFFLELEITLNNFGKLMGSTIYMMWNTFQVVGLIVLMATAVIGGIYFLVKYFKCVRHLTHEREYLDAKLSEFQLEYQNAVATLKVDVKDRASRLRNYISEVDDRLTEALNKPEVVPPTTKIEGTASVTTGASTSETTEVSGNEPQVKNDSIQDAPKTDAVVISNPY